LIEDSVKDDFDFYGPRDTKDLLDFGFQVRRVFVSLTKEISRGGGRDKVDLILVSKFLIPIDNERP